MVEEKWKKIKESYCDVLGYLARKSKGWINPESWKGSEERKQLKQKPVGTRSGKGETQIAKGLQKERYGSEEKFEKR